MPAPAFAGASLILAGMTINGTFPGNRQSTMCSMISCGLRCPRYSLTSSR